MLNDKPRSRRGGKHPPGHVARIRRENPRVITAFLSDELFRRVSKRLEQEGMSKQEFITRACYDLLKRGPAPF
jgi:hypothetical protein